MGGEIRRDVHDLIILLAVRVLRSGRRLGFRESRNRSAGHGRDRLTVLGTGGRPWLGKSRDGSTRYSGDRFAVLAASRRLRLGERRNGSAGNGRDGLPEGGGGDHFDGWLDVR